GAGSMLYGTTIPGSGTGCDTQGGKWTSASSANISCSTNGMTLNNSSSSQPAAVFLQTMKNGQQFPGSYVIQAQVTITNGNFGIVFLSQPAQNLTFAWMLDQGNNTGQVNSYTNGMGSPSPVTGPIAISQGNMGKTVTVDVTV